MAILAAVRGLEPVTGTNAFGAVIAAVAQVLAFHTPAIDLVAGVAQGREERQDEEDLHIRTYAEPPRTFGFMKPLISVLSSEDRTRPVWKYRLVNPNPKADRGSWGRKYGPIVEIYRTRAKRGDEEIVAYRVRMKTHGDGAPYAVMTVFPDGKKQMASGKNSESFRRTETWKRAMPDIMKFVAAHSVMED